MHEQADPPQDQSDAGTDQAQAFDMSVTEGLRRLARRYVDNPESLVDAVHLELGRSGRIRVVIVLETTDIL
jgi:hypothetical protein